MSANSHSQVTFNSGSASTAWCAARQRAFFKVLHALVHFLTGHHQERLLQRQFHMRIGQRFFDSSQFTAELTRLIYFMSFFHSDDLTILATAELPHPTHHRRGRFDSILALHRGSTGFPGLHLTHALHFEGFAVANYGHRYSVLFITKYQPISGRDPFPYLPSSNFERPTVPPSSATPGSPGSIPGLFDRA